MEGLIFFAIIGFCIFYCTNKKSNKTEKAIGIRDSKMTKILIQEILKSNYIDILVYKTHVHFDLNIKIYYSDYGYEDLTLNQTNLLAKEILKALPNNELYTIKQVTGRDGWSDGLTSVRHALGDYTSDSDIITLGYRLCNKNYDGRFYKIKNKYTGKYDVWDCHEHKWVQEKKKW